MESNGQRGTRNSPGELLGRVTAGESVLVRHDGVPAAVIVLAAADVRTRLVTGGGGEPAPGLARLPAPLPGAVPTEVLLADDRDPRGSGR